MLLDRYASWHGCSTCILKTQVGGVHSHLISRVQRDKIRDGCSISRNDIMTTVFPMFQLYIEPHLVCAHVSEFEANLRLYHSITFDIRNILRILWYAHLYFFAEVSVLPWIMFQVFLILRIWAMILAWKILSSALVYVFTIWRPLQLRERVQYTADWRIQNIGYGHGEVMTTV